MSKVESKGGKRKRKTNTESYASYIRKVLRKVYPDKNVGISKEAIVIMDKLVKDIFQRLAEESGKLAKYSNKRTITSSHVQSSVKLILPSDLSRHAVYEATKAMNKYNTNK